MFDIWKWQVYNPKKAKNLMSLMICVSFILGPQIYRRQDGTVYIYTSEYTQTINTRIYSDH